MRSTAMARAGASRGPISSANANRAGWLALPAGLGATSPASSRLASETCDGQAQSETPHVVGRFGSMPTGTGPGGVRSSDPASGMTISDADQRSAQFGDDPQRLRDVRHGSRGAGSMESGCSVDDVGSNERRAAVMAAAVHRESTDGAIYVQARADRFLTWLRLDVRPQPRPAKPS